MPLRIWVLAAPEMYAHKIFPPPRKKKKNQENGQLTPNMSNHSPQCCFFSDSKTVRLLVRPSRSMSGEVNSDRSFSEVHLQQDYYHRHRNNYKRKKKKTSQDLGFSLFWNTKAKASENLWDLIIFRKCGLLLWLVLAQHDRYESKCDLS